ncbi:MAG TPA: DUF4097 family beta strand repeat-containing protein [Aliicoccus persicus]|uniref:DUF4097 family beta strand repeat-containing protein n=1 Tax=Aliicoccus persicus TaxID=930138 RepID=A0A921JB55_9STAP|nr:DUF4097 family beta strand repeat-containing protein [Aliicoccus persicus]
MNHKAQILKMLEDGKINAEEAFKLIEALDKDSETSTPNDSKKVTVERPTEENRREKETTQESQNTGSKKNTFEDIFSDITNDFQKLFNSEKVSETWKNVRDSEQTQQVKNTVGKAFDSVKNTNFESMFSQGPKNRLIETIDEDINRMNIDVTHGNISIVPTERVTTVKFEVTPLYKKLDKKKNYFQDIICEVNDGNLNIVSDAKFVKVNVEILLNQDALKRIIISGTNGNVDLADHTFDELSVDLLNGNIKLDGTMSNNAFLRTSRGNVTVNKGSHKVLEMISMFGTINTGKLYAKELNVSANGAVNITLESQTESAILNSNMGNINLTVPRDRHFEGRMSTVLGQLNYPSDIEVRSMKHQDIGMKEVMLINDTDEPSVYLEVSTKFGSVTLHRK